MSKYVLLQLVAVIGIEIRLLEMMWKFLLEAKKKVD